MKPLHNQNQIYTRLSSMNKNYIIKICAEEEKWIIGTYKYSKKIIFISEEEKEHGKLFLIKKNKVTKGFYEKYNGIISVTFKLIFFSKIIIIFDSSTSKIYIDRIRTDIDVIFKEKNKSTDFCLNKVT